MKQKTVYIQSKQLWWLHLENKIIYYKQIDSTNTELSRMALRGAAHGTVVFADEQTAGKGRRGRAWESPKGENVYMSLLLRPKIQPEKAPMITLVMAYCVAKVLKKLGFENTEIKWPNDLVLSRKNNFVRSVDISEYMGYSKPSVSRAVSLLKAGGFITVEDDGHILLTDAGLAIAEKILSRQSLLTELLVRLGVSRETATADACRMEHVVSDETFDALQKHLLNFSNHQ